MSNCPKCGSELTDRSNSWLKFACGTYLFTEDRLNYSAGEMDQSVKCKVNVVTADRDAALAKADQATAEAAVLVRRVMSAMISSRGSAFDELIDALDDVAPHAAAFLAEHQLAVRLAKARIAQQDYYEHTPAESFDVEKAMDLDKSEWDARQTYREHMAKQEENDGR